jgi:hypothetical protein
VGLRTALIIVVLASAAACHKVEARTPVPPAPVLTLDSPSPPARVTIPVELPDYVPPPAPPETAAAPARPRPDTTTAPRTAAAPPAAPPANAGDAPAPVLQTTTDTDAQARETRDMLADAERNLQNVKYRELSPQAKAQYDTARSFIKTAQLALHNRNYPYAEQLATKAAAVARELNR